MKFGGKPPSAASGASAKEVRNWYQDRYQNVLVWRNIFAVFTLVALVISLVSVSAVRQLAPLKSVEPFVIQVEDKTGITQVVNPLTVKELTADEALGNFFVLQYVKARESYDPSLFNQQFDAVRVMSEPEVVFKKYQDSVSTRNPESVVTRLGNKGTRTVYIKSIQQVQGAGDSMLKIADVRMLMEETHPTSFEVFRQHLIARVEYRYQVVELTPQERFINPLGFIVHAYSINQDAKEP